MQNSNLKNIVVLKNLPSNLVDEAIVILKSNKNARMLQYIEKNSIIQNQDREICEDYIIKEAENVISAYISKIEKNKPTNRSGKNIENRYKKMKIYSIAISVALLICCINVIF